VVVERGGLVVVVGLARSGVAAAEYLARRGASVVATDRQGAETLPPEALRLRDMGVRLELGGHDARTFLAASLIVVSPGVPFELPELAQARAAGVPVRAEVELAFRELRGTVAAVTGTKGKSTTTAALGAMLAAAGRDARVGGNIGRPLVSLVEGSTDETVFAVEVSSFQLEAIDSFRPRVAVFLNLSPDHLDRHPSFAAYAAAKTRIFENQTADDVAVVNAEDPEVMTRARAGRARLVTFAPQAGEAAGADAFFAGGQARLRRGPAEEALFARASLRLPGAHLAGDLLAAAVAARELGASAEAIRAAAESFRGVEHVLEHVATVEGVDYYNDSKATNVAAARKSLEAFAAPVHLILGGRYKGGDFAELGPALRAHGRQVLAIGEARHRISAALRAEAPVSPCASLDEAVERAHAAARPGDVVLLAPACSSFDMFRDYAERGRRFKDAVHALAEGRRG
jgi:UDP-N-acetylmuramoylalanine--D-glutamate ligase